MTQVCNKFLNLVLCPNIYDILLHTFDKDW